MPYQIIFVDADTFIENPSVRSDARLLASAVFDDAKSATASISDHKDWCKRNGWTPARLRIQKIVTAAWEEREATRLKDGTYTPLPDWWQTAYWWTGNSHIHAKHFAHMSTKDSGKIAFTESPEKGEADIQLVLSPTKYLARFFGDYISASHIRDIGAMFEIGTDYELKMSFSPDDFERIYEAASDVVGEGSSYESCMRYKRDHFDTDRHPAYAYGAGDLAIAWIEDEEGNILGRVNVWPEKKTYVRVYGLNSKYHSLMHTLLKREGYTHVNDFEGARLLKYEVESDTVGSKHYLCPFIDGNRYRALHDRGDYFVLGRHTSDSFNGETTDGVIIIYEMVTCAKLGIKVRGDRVEMVDGQPWSRDALDRFPTNWCDVTNTRTQENVIRVIGQYGSSLWVRESVFKTMDTFMCQRLGAPVDRRYFEPIQVLTSSGPQIWSNHDRYAYRKSRKDGLYYARGYYPSGESETASPPVETDLSGLEARILSFGMQTESEVERFRSIYGVQNVGNWFALVEDGSELTPEDATF